MHKAMNLLVMCILVYAWDIPAAWAGEADSLLGDLIGDIVLVQGRVVERKQVEEHTMEQKAHIVQVYCGSDELVGKTFAFHTQILPVRPAFGSSGKVVLPMKIGEMVISEIRVNEDAANGKIGEWIVAAGRSLVDIDWPVSDRGVNADESEKAEYERAKAFAEALEQVSQANRANDRWEFLRKDAQRPVPEISAWAIRVIAETKPEWKDKFFQELVNTAELPIAGQIALDEALSDSRSDQWRYSSERASLISGWLADKLDERDLWRVMDRVTSLHRRGELDPKALLAISENALNNSALPGEDREKFVGFVLDAFRGAREEASACYLLFEQAQGSKDEKIRTAAAEKLCECILYYRGLLDHIRRLRDKTPDKNVQRILQSALDGPIDKDSFLRDLSTKTGKSVDELKLP